MLMNRQREKNNTRNEAVHLPKTAISWSITLIIRTLTLIYGIYLINWFSSKSITYCKLKMMLAYTVCTTPCYCLYTIILFINILNHFDFILKKNIFLFSFSNFVVTFFLSFFHLIFILQYYLYFFDKENDFAVFKDFLYTVYYIYYKYCYNKNHSLP